MQALVSNKKINADIEKSGLVEISKVLRNKADQAISPISKAKYSSLMVFQTEDQLLIFSGANIDPVNREDLKIPEKRNCAETQAVRAAQAQGLNFNNLVAMFLYRSPEFNRHFTAEKLLPCLVCNQHYVTKLIPNKGHLVLIIDDQIERQFFNADHLSDDENKIHQMQVNDHEINYLILDSEKLLFLNVEKALGSRVCEL